MKKKGILIAVEGISGSGKSEGIKEVFEYYKSRGYRASIVEWNSNKRIRCLMELLNRRKLLTPLVYSVLQWLSFYIDYFIKIMPLLKRGYVVIADRYVYTALTRDVVNGAGTAHGLILRSIAAEPDLLMFFDTSPHVCHDRISLRGKALFHTNKFIMNSRLLKNKDLYYLKRLRREYLKLLSKLNTDKDMHIAFINDCSTDISKHIDCYMDIKKGRAGISGDKTQISLK
ncbi:dTMP kinase [Anaerobacterium chartisolvens]|uniref:dTMP kinase n=1 Tax=Anaerobacterium chartisolvens TaxID=1297424 RepID=A0A369AW41_9FIRM|nr:thymidylate kinase [Anaerobacterium chartisolvens]RCX12558.1 dTMP kinase [Anaerobacterium chartisolvens]